MVKLPIKCDRCGRERSHYAACQCVVSIADVDLHDELEELIVERWRCDNDEGAGPECPAASPCPSCAKRKRALAMIQHGLTKPNQDGGEDAV